nr:MAG TPA: hypothetical protein [Bacteriophage sp.]
MILISSLLISIFYDTHFLIQLTLYILSANTYLLGGVH